LWNFGLGRVGDYNYIILLVADEILLTPPRKKRGRQLQTRGSEDTYSGELNAR
jgi:hypothetical protein